MSVDVLERPTLATEEEKVYVVLHVAGQTCGVRVEGVRDILGEQAITRIPLAPAEVAGSLNLRGRIVTAIDLRRRLGLPPLPAGQLPMSVVAEHGTEHYALVVDQVSEVMSMRSEDFEANPPTLDPIWASFSLGVFRLSDRLLVVLDVAKLLTLNEQG